MSQIHFLFILSLIFFSVSSVSLKREKTTTQSNYFLSFLRVVEFFKDASPSSNKMMNFHHYETAHRIINLVQTNNETFNSTNNETNDDNNITNLNNVTNDNNTTTNTSSQTKETNQLTVEDIQNIIHKENKILKDEILENENDIESDLKKESYKIYKKIDETEYKIVNKIVSSSEKLEKKIDKIEEKVDENIEQTEESSIIIISEQIKEKEENLKLLKAEINDLKIVLNNEKEITNVCELYNSCTDCTSNPKCGWCILEEKCVGGDHIGPSEEQCTFYSYHYCSSLSCARNTDCYSCLADPNCGWCKDSSRDLQICLEEQSDFKGCPSDGWFQVKGEKYECSQETNVFDKVNQQQKKEKESLNTMKKFDSDELDLNKKKEELEKKEILAKNLQDEISLLRDELETIQKRIKEEKEKEREIRSKIENPDQIGQNSGVYQNKTYSFNESSNNNESLNNNNATQNSTNKTINETDRNMTNQTQQNSTNASSNTSEENNETNKNNNAQLFIEKKSKTKEQTQTNHNKKIDGKKIFKKIKTNRMIKNFF